MNQHHWDARWEQGGRCGKDSAGPALEVDQAFGGEAVEPLHAASDQGRQRVGQVVAPAVALQQQTKVVTAVV